MAIDHVQRALQIAGSAPNIAENVTGPLIAATPGRTDTLPISVPDGAYIIPADVVSSIGQGNTNAGMQKLAQRFGTVPPRAAGHPVDIMAAAGEFVVSPQAVAAIGNGDLASGHKVLDAWVKMERDTHRQALSKMPPPVRSKR